MNPKISDFGMARIFVMNQTEADTNRVVGTYHHSCIGYMSPEYALYGQFSEKLDVFSFRVLLLEIVSGKKNAVFDESVGETCRLDEALRSIQVGLLCVQEDPSDRPTMSSIILMLLGVEATLPPTSKNLPFQLIGIPVMLTIPPMQTPPLL
ncbi:hypothetical protein DVH24_032266 [Malus domestica]|uniref:Protein kinase domain-containing protein n=1 Tax=Malus domestica TaxID=3750 RepID=A0A498J2D2_MALDO|nr:hypothetical protein DVH24_032266 [Malus domestica]